MPYIEPVGVRAKIQSENSTDYNYGASIEHNREIFGQMGYSFISNRSLAAEVENNVTNAYTEALSFEPELSDDMIPFGMHVSPDIRPIYYNSQCVVFPDRQYENYYLFMGDNKSDVHAEIEKFRDEVDFSDRLGRLLSTSWDVSSDNVKTELQVIRGKGFADFLTKRICDPVQIEDEFDNRFERKIFQDVTDNLTSCVTTNADLFIGDRTDENREYDLLLHVSPTMRIYIEAKRVLAGIGTNQNKNWKHDIIGKPFEYKTMLHQQASTVRSLVDKDRIWDKTECFVVVDHLDETHLSDFEDMAIDRDIKIVEYDENGNYLERIYEEMRDMVHKFTKPLGYDDPMEKARNRRSL